MAKHTRVSYPATNQQNTSQISLIFIFFID
ncbi:hypothetical protein IWT5_01141 [Secundilactobacillus silagincola]|uniref:Uncharacterized protein n=1 Tax=Secundilactobacillus silagincola TaxID=1714681 RepID=A0A1Z5J1M8_9LACO|nr:hypothetical protein IWT5_01141 [Secundilactobacillus silagincola]